MIEYLKQVCINGSFIDVGSDYHFHMCDVKKSFHKIMGSKRCDNLLVLGDVFNSSTNSSEQVNNFINMLSNEYDIVGFVAGNHDLRHRGMNAWDEFKFNKNVLYPVGNSTVDMKVGKAKILLANVGYDQSLIDISFMEDIGITKKNLEYLFVENFNDGKLLFGGGLNLDLFKSMSASVIEKLDYSYDAIATHAIVDSSCVTIKEHSFHNGLIEYMDSRNIEAEYDGFDMLWNVKSYFMGSDILSKSRIKNGFISLHGHNHRSCDRKVIINGNVVKLVSHQINAN